MLIKMKILKNLIILNDSQKTEKTFKSTELQYCVTFYGK